MRSQNNVLLTFWFIALVVCMLALYTIHESQQREYANLNEEQIVEIKSNVIILAICNSVMAEKIEYLMPPKTDRVRFHDYGLKSKKVIPKQEYYMEKGRLAKDEDDLKVIFKIQEEMEADFILLQTLLKKMEEEKQA